MEKETKRYLIIGTTIVVTVGIGVVLWKKYQTSSSASAAASDQSNQDELSLLAASLESNAYASATGGGASYSPQMVGIGAPQSLADEVLSLEQALGFAPTTPTPAPSSPSTPAASGGGNPSPSPAPSPTPTPGAPAPVNPSTVVHNEVPTNELIRYNHGSPIFEMDGVTGEGVLVS